MWTQGAAYLTLLKGALNIFSRANNLPWLLTIVTWLYTRQDQLHVGPSHAWTVDSGGSLQSGEDTG